MEDKYIFNVPPNNKEIELSKFSYKGWDFYSHTENMLNSKDLDILIKNKEENGFTYFSFTRNILWI